jgi:hypothetical protein
LPRHPFDLTLAEMAFPRVGTPVDDSAFTAAILKRSQELTPSASEQAAISNLVSKVQAVLDTLIVTPEKLPNAVSNPHMRVCIKLFSFSHTLALSKK